jgi:hypothetical protein
VNILSEHPSCSVWKKAIHREHIRDIIFHAIGLEIVCAG